MRQASIIRLAAIALTTVLVLDGTSSEASYTPTPATSPPNPFSLSNSNLASYTFRVDWDSGDAPITSATQFHLEIWDDTQTVLLDTFTADTYYSSTYYRYASFVVYLMGPLGYYNQTDGRYMRGVFKVGSTVVSTTAFIELDLP